MKSLDNFQLIRYWNRILIKKVLTTAYNRLALTQLRYASVKTHTLTDGHYLSRVFTKQNVIAHLSDRKKCIVCTITESKAHFFLFPYRTSVKKYDKHYQSAIIAISCYPQARLQFLMVKTSTGNWK